MVDWASDHALGFAASAIEAVLVDRAAIQRRIDELGAAIDRDYRGREIHIVSVLRGSMTVVADLLRAIRGPVSVDFIAVSSYGPGARHHGTVRLIKDLDQPIEGKDVLVLEDIIDTGLTLSYILRILRSRKPATLEIGTFLDKPARRLIDFPLRYVGFTVPDRFVVGYGLDYQGQYRNLPYIATLKPEILKEDR